MDKQLDEILVHFSKQMAVADGINNGGALAEAQTYVEMAQAKAKQQILALINEARIDELKYVRGFGERSGHDRYCQTIGEAVINRIAEPRG